MEVYRMANVNNCPCDCFDSQEELHRDLTWAEFQNLSSEELNNGTIYFITDLDSKQKLIEELIAEIRRANDLLESLRTYPFIDEIEPIDKDLFDEPEQDTGLDEDEPEGGTE